MLTYREYRQLAETCVGWAQKAKSQEERRAFIEMAAAWTVQAAKAEAAEVSSMAHRPSRSGGQSQLSPLLVPRQTAV